MPPNSFSPALLLSALVATGCVLITPFEYGGEGPGIGGSGATPSAGGQPAAGGSGVGGGGDASGGGGGDPCAGLALDTSENCGECGFECDGPCDDGACGEVIDIGGNTLESIVVDGEYLYFVESGPTSARILSLPTDFTSTTEPTVIRVVDDSPYPDINGVGTLVRGSHPAKHIYYNAQASKVIHACDQSGCEPIHIGPTPTFISFVMAPTAHRIYFGDVVNGLYSIALDADGVPMAGDPPGAGVTLEVASHAVPVANGGISHAYFSPPETLYWSSQVYGPGKADGCVFRALLSELAAPDPITDMPCWSSRFGTAGFAVGVDGTVYAQDGWDLAETALYTVRSFAPVTAAENPLFVSNADFPRAVDEKAFYTSTQSTIGPLLSGDLRRVPLDGSPEVVIAEGADPGGIDAIHASYVFFTSGSQVHRLPKAR